MTEQSRLSRADIDNIVASGVEHSFGQQLAATAVAYMDERDEYKRLYDAKVELEQQHAYDVMVPLDDYERMERYRTALEQLALEAIDFAESWHGYLNQGLSQRSMNIRAERLRSQVSLAKEALS